MSIIHEALKKVQSNRSENKPQPQKSKSISRIIVALGAVLILIICGISGYQVIKLANRNSDTLAPVITNATISTSPTLPVVNLPPPSRTKRGQIFLTGIVIMDGRNFALINDEFYEEGEKVEGAKITKITDDSVDILQKGKTRTIKVIRPD